MNSSVWYIGTTAGLNYNITGLTDADYYYVVTANNILGNSTISNWEDIIVNLPAIAPPSAPFLYTITPNPSLTGLVYMNWTFPFNTDNFTVYRSLVYITVINGSVQQITITVNTYYNDAGLANGTYYYAITANNVFGSSPLSNCQQVNVSKPAMSIPYAPTLQPIYNNPNHSGNISLTWSFDPNSQNFTVYCSNAVYYNT